MAPLIYRVLVVGLVRQLRRRLAHVQLARHHVGDEPGAVLLEQLDLAAGAAMAASIAVVAFV